MSRMKINLKLLPIKLHFFFYFGGTASLWPFISVFAKQMGISELGVGYIFAVAPIAGLIAKPFFGAVADRFKKKKKLFIFFILLNFMSYMCVAYLPQSLPVRPVELECGSGFSLFRQRGRMSNQCGQLVTDSFLPEEVRNKKQADRKKVNSRFISEFKKTTDFNDFDHSLTQDTENEKKRVKKWILENDEYVEYCTAECNIFLDINTFFEGDRLCRNLLGSSTPRICEVILNRTELLHTDSNGTSPFLSEHGTMLKMGVKLKLTEVMNAGEDLFLPIESISFLADRSDYHGLSCSQKSVLDVCFLTCSNNTALNSHLEVIPPETELLDSMNFWLYGSLIVIAWVAMAVVTSVGDALCFDTLEDRPEFYGYQRQWGAVGWGTFSLIAGYFIDTSSDGRLLKDYTPCFYLVAGLLTLDLIVTYKWDIRERDKPKSLRKDVCLLLSDLRIIVFILACIIVGMCTGLLWSFLFWYVEDLAKLNSTSCDYGKWLKLLEGLIVAVQCFGGEVPFFHLSGWFIKKLGHVHCITLVLAAFGVRFIIYSFLTNPWSILPVELFQGLTFGLFYATMASYAFKVSPPGTAATVQGIVGSSFEGIGVSAGSLIGGLLFRKSAGKGVTAFRLFGCGALIFSALHALAMFILNRKVTYGIPVDTTEPEGQEMFRISGSNPDVDSE